MTWDFGHPWESSDWLWRVALQTERSAESPRLPMDRSGWG